MFILIVVLVILGSATSVGCTKQGNTALSFGRTKWDYVEFQPGDMSPFASSLTLCSWMKRMHSASRSIMLHYYPGQITLGSNGVYNDVNRNLNLRGEFPGTNVWFHYCLSWAAGGTQRVYINGVEVGSRAASSTNLRLGGTIYLGNGKHIKDPGFVFGGELYKLNLFSEQLTSSQIREIADSGMCSEVEEKYETRLLKWEQILTKQRHGNVRDIALTAECPSHDIISGLYARLNQAWNELRLTKNTLQNIETTLNSTLSDLTETRTQLNETRTELE